MARRNAICGFCNSAFQSGIRGSIAKTCPKCRKTYFWLRVKKLDSYMQAYLRAENKCELCKIDGVKLNIHHRDGNGTGCQSPNNEINNLTVLCAKCHMKAHKITKTKRHSKILKLRNKGLAFEAIGTKFGISRQRVHQILKAENFTGY